MVMWGNHKDPKNTAIMRDKKLCDEAAKRNDYKCDDVTRNWPTTVFYDIQDNTRNVRNFTKISVLKLGQMWIQCDICNNGARYHKCSSAIRKNMIVVNVRNLKNPGILS